MGYSPGPPSQNLSDEASIDQESFKEFDDLIKLIESEELENKRVDLTHEYKDDNYLPKEKVLLSYFYGGYDLGNCRDGGREDQIAYIGNAEFYNPKKGWMECREVIAVSKKKKKIFGYCSSKNMEKAFRTREKRQLIYPHRKEAVIEVEKEFFESLWDECVGLEKGKIAEENETMLWSSANERKVGKFLLTLSDYLKGEIDSPINMFVREDQKLPAKLKEMEKEVDATVLLKIKKDLETEFKKQVEEHEIKNENDLKEYTEKTGFAKRCGLETIMAKNKIIGYKTQIRQELEEKVRKAREEKKNQLKKIDSALESL